MEVQSYELSASQNKLLKDLADKMRFVSFFLIGLGILLAIGGVVMILRGGLGNIVLGISEILVGFWTNRAASAFHKVVNTQGNDIENLMGGLGELRKLYTLQVWLYFIALCFVALGVAISIIFDRA